MRYKDRPRESDLANAGEDLGRFLIKLLGFSVIVAGSVFSLYVGVWELFVGGIMDVVRMFQAFPIQWLNLPIALLKIVIAPFFTLFTISGCVILGMMTLMFEDL